jgi:diguanylate cyclase (GGDEF)-like protein/PAS domain S-box-containing protein
MKKKLKCWEVFECQEKDCPAYKSKGFNCWLIAGNHCYKQIEGKFLEKLEICLECEVFRKNIDVASMKETIKTLSQQIKEHMAIAEKRDAELETVSLDMSIGLSKAFEMVKKLRMGDPTARLVVDTENELLVKLETELNQLADSVEEMVNESHETAMGLCEHYDTLNKIAAGQFDARASETSKNELIAKLGKLLNKEAYTLIGLIEELQRTDEELITAYQRVNDIIDFLPDATFVIDKDRKVIAWNHAIEEMTGVKKEKMLGKGNYEYAVPFYGEAKPVLVDFVDAGEEKIRQKYSHVKKKGNTLITEVFIPSFRGGSYLWAIATPLFDRDGNKIGAIESVRDITESKLVERSVKESEEKFRSLIDNIPDVTWTADREGRLIFISNKIQNVLGYAPEEMCQDGGGLWFGRIHPDDAGHVRKSYEMLFAENKVFDTEYRIQAKDGHWVWLRNRAASTRVKDNVKYADGVARDITARKQSEEELHRANEKLKIYVEELEQYNRESATLGEMGDMLKACITIDEVYIVIVQSVKQLFPDYTGALCIINASRNIVETVREWGESSVVEPVFTPDDCWALRRGRIHIVENHRSGLACHHISRNLSGYSICIPLIAQTQAVGILYLQKGLTDSETMQEHFTESKKRLALTMAEHISLAIANLRLQETLRNQAIRDPLTGLFNRRYMEETLEREIMRSVRKHSPLGIIMIDIDHFKQFNDIHGHEAGDAMLRAIGDFLKTKVRSEDVVCRYGGEEFAIILPEASLDITKERAEKLRGEVKLLNVEYHRKPLDTITLSLGIAIFPDHGRNGEAVLKAADIALYRAKTEGRDKVVMAA